MERRWLQLARSFAFAGSLKDFTAANVEHIRYLDEFCRDSDKRVRARRNELRWLASIIESSDDAIITACKVQHVNLGFIAAQQFYS